MIHQIVNAWVFTKMGNDLKRPTTTYNKQEMTWNNVQRPTTSKKPPETTYIDLKSPITNKKQPENDLQQARNDLKQPTSITQPTTTWTNLQRAKKWCKLTTNKQILRLFYNMGQSVLFSNSFSSQHLVAIILFCTMLVFYAMLSWELSYAFLA